MISYIIAMNNTYALMSNFFGFLLPSVKPDDEIIIACDGCDSTATMDYLNSLAQIDLRIRLIKLKEKLTLQNRRLPLEQVHLMQSWVIALQLAEEHQLNLMEIPQ